LRDFNGSCTRCGKLLSGQFPIKKLLAVFCEDCNREWERYFSERFDREHGTLLGFHTPIEPREKEIWFKEFLNKKESVKFT
jgi:hypothetical protein